MKYPLTEQVIEKAAEYQAAQTKLQLQAKRKRISIRATWKKTGDNWTPVSVEKKTVNKNFVATGNLVRSVKPFSQDLEFGVEFAWYGQAIIEGRKPWGKYNGGKGIPVDVMKKWTNDRRLRPRNSQNQFIKNTKSNRNAMAFMMNRKIKYFGIEPYDFAKLPRQVTLQKFNAEIKNAIKKDIENSRL